MSPNFKFLNSCLLHVNLTKIIYVKVRRIQGMPNACMKITAIHIYRDKVNRISVIGIGICTVRPFYTVTSRARYIPAGLIGQWCFSDV